MATHTEPERTEALHNESIQTEARYTPLTKEAKAHLQAAGSLVDDRFNEVQCMIESAIEPLKESNRHIGFELTLSDDEVYRIVRSVEGALSHGQSKVVAPVYARLRGERPYVENGDEPSANGGGESEDDVVNALGLAKAAIGLASDGELTNVADGEGRNERAVWRDIYERIRPVLMKALGEDREDREAWEDGHLDTVNALVRGAEGAADDRAPDPPAAGLDHGLAWEAITTLALAEQLAMDFGHRFIGDRMLHELAEVRHRIEDEIGVDGHLSDRIVGHAGERYAAWQEGRQEGVDA